MGKAKPLKIRIFVNGEERLPTPEERARGMERIGRTMSLYFAQHPEEYADFCRRYDAREAEKAKQAAAGAES